MDQVIMYGGDNIQWIKETCLGYSVRNVVRTVPHIHEDLIEIIMCVAGEIRMSYCFEEFLLKTGDFILVDRDTHYLYGGKNATCAFLYLDLGELEKIHPGMQKRMYVCEYTDDSQLPHHTPAHERLKGIVLAILLYLAMDGRTEHPELDRMAAAAENLADVIDKHFDILDYYNPDSGVSDSMRKKYIRITNYIFDHYKEKITLEDLAELTGNNKSYISEFMGKYIIGFQEMVGFARLCFAEKLLMTTDMSMMQISEECGFSDPKYLYHHFKKWYNCTPGDFKKRYFHEMLKDTDEQEISIASVRSQLDGLVREHFLEIYM